MARLGIPQPPSPGACCVRHDRSYNERIGFPPMKLGRFVVPLSSLSALLFSTVLAAHAGAQTVVLSNDFEDGTLQNWIPRGGGVVLTNTEEVAPRPGGTGTHSLKTTNRT